MENLKGRRVTVLGAGESGFQSALFLKKKGAHFFLSEIKDGPLWAQTKAGLERAGIACEFGSHNWDRISKSNLAVISPCIPLKASIYKKLSRSKIPIWSEIELASRFCPSDIIAVTGTSGKTTVTTLIRDVLKQGGIDATSCGNIGNAFIREIEAINSKTIVVLEVSSFQLMHIDRFRPHVAVLLNISDNHLDWHSNFKEYQGAKWRIFKNQIASDYSVINGHDIELVRKAETLPSEVVYFDGDEGQNPNFAVVEQVALLYEVKREVIRSVFKEFKGLEHRLEEVGIYHGVRYVNDSKSTTIASLEWALKRIHSPIVLIVGGRYKGGDFYKLRELVQKKVKFVVAIGEAKRMIAEAFDDLVTVYPATAFEEAVGVWRGPARGGETVLFSPACSSFDMFQNYIDRGRKFKNTLRSWREERAAAIHP